MRADALQPLKATLEDDDAAPEKAELRKSPYSEEELQEARQFLRLSVSGSLLTPAAVENVLIVFLMGAHRLRRTIGCNWCLTTYAKDMRTASGAERSMTTRKTWIRTVRDRRRTLTIEQNRIGRQDWMSHCCTRSQWRCRLQ